MQSLTRKNIRKASAALLITGAFAAAGTVAVLATAPAQAVDTCRLKVHTISTSELQDNDARDEIKFELGDNEYGIYTFPDDWQRHDSLNHPDEDFVTSVSFSLWDKDGVVRNSIDTDTVTGCDEGWHTMDLVGNGAIYEMEYELID
jgi:hypothetical protein